MPRNWSKAVPEGNGLVPQPDFGPDRPTLVDIYRLFKERFDRQLNRMKSHFDELTEKMRETRQRLAGFEHDARQPRLVMKVDVPSETKTRERTEGATAAVQAKHGDSCSANQVDPDPMYLISFGDDSTGPSALPCSRDDALVDNGAVGPKSCLLPLDMRLPTAAPVSYSRPAQPRQRRGPLLTSHLFGSVRPTSLI